MHEGKLRDAIAETMWARVSAHDLAHVCDVLGMPDGPPNADPRDSKRRYVRNRLIALSPAEIADMSISISAAQKNNALRNELRKRGIS